MKAPASHSDELLLIRSRQLRSRDCGCRPGGSGRRKWKPACKSVGLDDTDPRNGCHRGRHTFASLLLAEGESVAAVAEWMGNTPAVVLRTYAHLMPSSEERTRRVIDEAFLPAGVTTVSREAL